MTVALSVVEACCASLYGHPLVELIAGESFHPGGLASTRRALDAARLPAKARVLDAGCGLGASARLAALEFGLVVDACDVSSAAIQRARVLAESAGARVRFTEASLLEDLASSSGFQIERAWDETEGIVTLLDRIEARMGLLTTLAHELAGTDLLRGLKWGPPSIADMTRMSNAIQDARRLVTEGRIGYRAVVGRAVRVETEDDRLTTIAATGTR